MRALWLVVHERTEAVLADVVAVRVQAAAIAAALRITTEDLAAAPADGATPPPDAPTRLSDALHAATHGVVGDGALEPWSTHP